MSSSFAALLALLCFAGCALAWGPVSHQYFTCGAHYSSVSVPSCYQNDPVMMVGADFPDAFGFGAFKIDALPDYQCANLTYAHDPMFGGFMILMAMNTSDPHNTWPGALSFSKGFVAHIMGDLVGFNPKQGVLCTAQSSKCSADGILYMPEWGYMTAIDSFFYNGATLDSIYNQLPVPNNATMGQAAYEWIAYVSREYNKLVPTFGSFSAVAVQQCADYWSGNMQYVYNKGQFIASGGSQAFQYLLGELNWFRPASTNSTNIEDYLLAQATCSSMAITNHFNVLLKTQDFKAAVTSTIKYVATLYAQGICTNVSSKKQQRRP